MKNRVLLFLILLLPCSIICQKGLRKKSINLVFPLTVHECSNALSQVYRDIEFYSGEPRGLDFKDDFVYYNPARYLESLSKKHDHTSKVTNSRLISSP
ncbi:MAG: hypothetical protein AAF806_24460, partial [Bacteroidota bacterium]